MTFKLIVLSEGQAKGKAIPITLSQFLIGRDKQCQLRPVSPLISKRHCALLTKGEKVFLRDFASTNGTFVNEVRVEGEVELHDGDVLKVGPLVFRVRIEKTVSVSQPTPPPRKLLEPAPADDESIAALLLEEDGSASAIKRDELSESDVPSGSTIMDMVAPETPGAAAKADEKKDDKKKAAEHGSTSAAAAAILSKYQRRQRG